MRQGDITLTEWDILMHLMEKRKEMIDELLVMCHDMVTLNKKLVLCRNPN